MDRIKINRINYYILLSALIHCFFFFINNEKKDVTQGEKIIPIEIIDNLQETGYGEATKRSKKIIKRPSLKKDLQKDKTDKKIVDHSKSSPVSKIIKKENKKRIEQMKVKSNSINQTLIKEAKGSGSREGIKNNEPEKGSLKGKGLIKVTCLKCVRPVYPPIALRRGAEGTPKVKVWINKNGKVFKSELIRFSGNDSIDRAAKKAASKSIFYPLEEETSINIEYDLKIR